MVPDRKYREDPYGPAAMASLVRPYEPSERANGVNGVPWMDRGTKQLVHPLHSTRKGSTILASAK